MADELAKLLGDRYVQRRDVVALQFADGHYEPRRSRMTWGDLRSHIDGTMSIGHYLLDADDLARCFVFDLDIKKAERDSFKFGAEPRLVRELMTLAEGLARKTHEMFDVHVAISFSGNKGCHVTAFTGPAPAGDLRVAAHAVLDSWGCFIPQRGDNFFVHVDEFPSVEIETFPKQSTLDGKDLGNLCRLPLGANRKSGKRSFFVRVDDDRDSFHEMDAMEALNGRLPWE